MLEPLERARKASFRRERRITMELLQTMNPVEERRAHDVRRSGAGLWSGRILSGLAITFLAVDAVGKLLRLAPVMEGTIQLGYPASAVVGIGVVLLACVLLYAVPSTAVLGAVLLTGYLGGAVATQVRVGAPLATHVLFPIYVAAAAWGGLFLRDARVRALLPLRVRG
jgi:hypothetical protein